MTLSMEFTPEDDAFREEVRAFLETHLTEDLREEARRQTTVFAEKDVALKWQRILHENTEGWATPAWPVEFGGPGWNATQRYIFQEECVKAGAPGLIPLGLRMLAPVLFKYGTKQQQEYYLPRMLTGEHYWCQGYSEPGSGSDLSSLKTTAVVDGDDYVVNGTKIWTTHGHYADHIFCLVRTDPDVKPQAGISFLLIEMDRPGIEVAPIITIAGDHEVNQVFFDDVRVPRSNLVGPENEGWTVAKYLLEFERGGGSAATGLRKGIEALRVIAAEASGGEGALLDDPSFAGRIDALEIRVDSLELTELQTLARLAAGESPGAASSLAKNNGVELNQELHMLQLETIAHYGIPHHNLLRLQGSRPGANENPVIGPEAWEAVNGRYINFRASSIYGGSREVQKNIIAKAVLGL